MKDALLSTIYCDHEHPRLQAVAADLKKTDTDPAVIARRTFYFVRDELTFGYDLYRRKASEVLKQGYGVCWNKALLLTALLRCNQIPARLGSIPLKRTFVEPVIRSWYWLANNPFHHCITYAYLNQRWTLLDVVLDKQTYATFFLPLDVEWGIDWNGHDDIYLYKESIVGPAVPHMDIDASIERKVGNVELPKSLALLGYRHVNKQIWKRTAEKSPLSPRNKEIESVTEYR